uniref:TonB-dependent receptor n=1 Tax=Ramlibacter sp. 2FC TaxID=2502188 RepID=UPI0032E3B3A7
PLLPLGAMLLAGSMSALAQPAPADEAQTLKTVVVKERAEGKEALRATTTGIGKGEQQLRDIPQSVTVVTEKLIDDRNLDTLKEALKNTAGISFLAAEGGEEDIRLRGFSLATSGDIFVDGLRDPAFYERDTFNNDRIELLRGSASMLFGRGSTGGAVNQVNKQPRLLDTHEVSATVGSHGYRRVTGDFNLHTGENAALRINAMGTQADNNGAGSSLDKRGIAGTYRWGIGTADEFSAGLYHLDNRNGINYGLPWIRPTASASVAETTLLPLDPKAYYGMASDRNNGAATYGTLSHLHRFQDGSALKTTLRKGHYDRDQRASAIRFVNPTYLSNFGDATVLRRGTNNKIQDLDTVMLQSDFSTRFTGLGVQHELLAGVDYSRESFVNYNATTPTGVTLTKPNTTVGKPNDGAWIDESRRVLSPGRTFEARAAGIYAQDMVQIAPTWKLLGGLRYDRLRGDYWQAATATAAAAARSRSDGVWSKRVGLLYQPDELSSYHISYGTSFNTSGDTYQYDALGANTPPEGSQNIELGAKLDSADKRYTTRLALFHATKTNERNRDPDSAASAYLLSGKRHTAGFEIDLTGRLTPSWEIYGSYAWTPIAKIDVGAPTTALALAGELQGQRPSLTPRHSGTIWSTYQLTPKWRVGGGLNFRSSQTPNRNPGWAAPSFVTADLMAEYLHSEQLAFKANLNNVTNKLYADALYSGHYIPGAGRLFQLQATMKF